MYIDKQTIIQIISIMVMLIHIVLYLILFLKIHKLQNGNKSLTLKEVGEKLKAAGGKIVDFLSPLYPNIANLLKKVIEDKSGEKSTEEANSEETRDNG